MFPFVCLGKPWGKLVKVQETSSSPRFQTNDLPSQWESWGGECAEWGEQVFGVVLMPWQRDLLEQALAHVDGVPVHDAAVVLSVPRQQGKTYVVRLIISWWAHKFPESGLGLELIRAGVDCRVFKGVPERIEFGNGSVIHVAAPNHTSLHGATISGVCVVDEGWVSLTPEMLQAVVPARAAAPLSLMVILSTMGTEEPECDTWNDYVARGREGEPGISYTEFSMADADDLQDENQWGGWMPALGRTVSKRSIGGGIRQLTPGEARRAYGNRTTSVEHVLFDMEAWHECQDVFEQPPIGALVLGVSASASDPKGAAVVATWKRADERWHTEVVEYRPAGGVLWLMEALEDLILRYKPMAVSIGGSSAVFAIKAELETLCDAYAIPFKRLAAWEEVGACGVWSEILREGNMTHGQSEALDLSMQFAIPKQDGESGYRIDGKRMKVDSSPLTSAVAALSIAIEEEATRPVAGIF